MKKLAVTFVFLGLLSCGSKHSDYEAKIAKVIQTDRNGTKYDLDFKTIEIEELKQISIGDSIKILTEEFNADKDRQIQRIESSLNQNAERLEKEKNSRIASKAIIAHYQSEIDKANELLNSVKATVAPQIAKYESRNSDEILAVVIRCKYEIDHPLSKVRVQETFDFVLSPDGKRFFSKHGVVK